MGPKEAMQKFADWIAKVSGDKKPIFVGSPITFDWCFVNYYFIKFLGYNPFGVSGIDLKSRMDWKNQQQMACNYNRRHKEKAWFGEHRSHIMH